MVLSEELNFLSSKMKLKRSWGVTLDEVLEIHRDSYLCMLCDMIFWSGKERERFQFCYLLTKF